MNTYQLKISLPVAKLMKQSVDDTRHTMALELKLAERGKKPLAAHRLAGQLRMLDFTIDLLEQIESQHPDTVREKEKLNG